MSDRARQEQPEAEDGQIYNKLLRLDELESLMEDIEDGGSAAKEAETRMVGLGFNDRNALRTAIEKLHREIDEEE